MRKFNFNNAEDLQKFKALSKEEMITELIRSAHYTPFSDHVVELEKDIVSNIRKLSSSSIAQIYKELSSVANLKPTELAEKVLEVCGYLTKPVSGYLTKSVSKAAQPSKPEKKVTNNNAKAATNMMQPHKVETSTDDLKWLADNVTFGKAMAAKVQNDGRSVHNISNALRIVEKMDGANIIPSPPEKVWKLINCEAKYSNMYDMAFKAKSKAGEEIVVHVNSKSGLFVPNKKSA